MRELREEIRIAHETSRVADDDLIQSMRTRYMYVCMYVCMQVVCVYVCMCVCMYVCMYVCVYVCIYVYIYIYVYVLYKQVPYENGARTQRFTKIVPCPPQG